MEPPTPWLQKSKTNAIFAAIKAAGLDPKDFDLEDDVAADVDELVAAHHRLPGAGRRRAARTARARIGGYGIVTASCCQ